MTYQTIMAELGRAFLRLSGVLLGEPYSVYPMFRAVEVVGAPVEVKLSKLELRWQPATRDLKARADIVKLSHRRKLK